MVGCRPGFACRLAGRIGGAWPSILDPRNDCRHLTVFSTPCTGEKSAPAVGPAGRLAAVDVAEDDAWLV